MYEATPNRSFDATGMADNAAEDPHSVVVAGGDVQDSSTDCVGTVRACRHRPTPV